MSDAVVLDVMCFDHQGIPVAYVVHPQTGVRIHVELTRGVPGDRLLVHLGKKRRDKCVGFVRDIVVPSSLRQVPRCVHVPICGGCRWQEMGYAHQLGYKEHRLHEIFRSWTEEGLRIPPLLPCDDPWHYRNKMEFSFSQDRKGNSFLGLMLHLGKGRVLNLRECHLVATWYMDALLAVRRWWCEYPFPSYQPYRDTGVLRTLTLREGKRTGQKMAILTVSGRPEYAISRSALTAWVNVMQGIDPSISCFLRIQQLCKGQPTQFYEYHLSGPDHILEMLHLSTAWGERSLSLQISPSAFFQPNTIQAERLYSVAIDMLDLSPTDHVLDLFCGTATIAVSIAPLVQHVTAIEVNPYALCDAEANLLRNCLHNVSLLRGDVADMLKSWLATSAPVPRIVVVDPPRSGLGSQVVSLLHCLAPEKILYISCNPVTQAEDCRALDRYTLSSLQGVDQFPHTPHIENIVLLTLRP